MADSSKEEQARKALALAERCFLAGNVTGARQWVQSAARLAPGLPGSAQAAAAYDVHAAAAAWSPVDWYAVLGLQPSGAGVVLAHDDVKRQHRRLCLLVHPDKNPSAAADGAFKLVQAAWEALSARHPPAHDATTAAARPPPWPPDPPPQQQPPQPRQRRPTTTTHRGAHQGPMPSYADAARAPRPQRPPAPGPAPAPPPRAPRVPPPSPASRCPCCGALTPYGKRSLRCMVCHWSPKDRWRVPRVDAEDLFE